MAGGVSINIYYLDGAEGITITQVSNWTGQVVKIPRNSFVQSKNLTELQRPGVYLLLGQDIKNPEDKIVYVGEANNLAERINTHIRNMAKSFAETIVCFCSKDENLTVSHTKYLEYKTIELLNLSTKFRLMNQKKGPIVNLSRMMKAEMDTYFDHMKFIFPTLGQELLHHVAHGSTKQGQQLLPIFYLKIGNSKASAILSSNGIIIQKGSKMRWDAADSLPDSYSNHRKKLIKKKIVLPKDDEYIFSENYEFASPSAAATIILGYSVNGRTIWKNSQGKAIKDIED